MRQVGMWLTLIGFACLASGIIMLFSGYSDTMAAIEPEIDKIRIAPDDNTDAIYPLTAKLQDHVNGIRRLSSREKMDVYARLVKAYEVQVKTLRQALSSQQEIFDLKLGFARQERRATIPIAVGLVMAALGVVLLVVSPLNPEKKGVRADARDKGSPAAEKPAL